jgi:peptide/nickel transport system substrate-binding protein
MLITTRHLSLLARRSPLSRYSNRSLWSALITMCAVVFVLAGCGSSGGSANSGTTASKGGNIVVGLASDPKTLDPLTSTSLYNSDVMANTYDTLLQYDTQNNIQPSLALSYTYTSPTMLSLQLRTDVKFQDGTPFNADAVIFNINRFLNDKGGPRYTDVEAIDSVQKVSDSQVQIKLKKPFAPLLNVLTGPVGMMLSPTAVKSLGAQLGNAPKNAGSGPFVFSEWIKGDHLLLKANPNYWQKDKNGNRLPYLQSITYHPISNYSVMYDNLETNQIQVATNIDPNVVSQAKANPDLTYRQEAGPGTNNIEINVSAAPFNNVHVRRAIAWGVNRAEILHNVYKDVGVVATGPLSPVSWAYDKNLSGFTYDVNKAKAELAQSGLSKVSFTLLITGDNPTIGQEAQFIQSELQPTGITINIKQETFTTLITDYQTGNYQALLVGWTGSIDPDGVMYALFTSKGSLNYTKYANSQVDNLLEQGRTTVNQAQRTPYYQQAQALIVQDVTCVFIFHPAVYQATTSKVKNYPLLASDVINLTSVYLSS